MAHVLPDEIADGADGCLYNYAHGATLHPLRRERWGLLWSKTIWDVTLDATTPLMWQDGATDILYMADRHEAETDLGSIPPPLRSLFPQDECVPAYVMHDSAYRYGGLWTASTLDSPWVFRPMDRASVDRLCLLSIMEAYGVPAWRRRTVWSAVRSGGWSCWRPRPTV